MRLNQASDFALRIVMQCALQPEISITVSDVVTKQNLSRAHVMKLVARLGRTGILRTIRGRSGGFRLGREASTISIGDVVRAVEADFAVVACMQPSDGECIDCCFLSSCSIKGVMHRAVRAFMKELDSASIEDMCKKMPLPEIFKHQMT
ncbi:MAG: Rrf2 family transcriptional regulator [Hyphomicrobiales bacterium]|nr:MAG: Rrf2 family transcriptional regulator [Hyphomicrobiales bacterium]